ncbi:hypothetical protein DY000_02041076 [Brassica cretica]|uniref:Uncharacterized protein n=1 Tax=Brassica cretica TaxID=69181 RepID=A0ABQ7B643_BRACR|nr:hypothetical protein DY000_02041076 [Brassica cretica]
MNTRSEKIGVRWSSLRRKPCNLRMWHSRPGTRKLVLETLLWRLNSRNWRSSRRPRMRRPRSSRIRSLSLGPFLRRGIIGLQDDRKIWVETHKNFQADIDDMEVIRLDPDRDLRVDLAKWGPLASQVKIELRTLLLIWRCWTQRYMPSSTRSNKETHLLVSEDPAHLERSIRKDQRSTSLDAAVFTSTDSRTQPSTDTRPSSSTVPHRSTSIDTTPLTSIDPQSRNMIAIFILRQDENGNLYDQDGHLRNATGQKLDAQGN